MTKTEKEIFDYNLFCYKFGLKAYKAEVLELYLKVRGVKR